MRRPAKRIPALCRAPLLCIALGCFAAEPPPLMHATVYRPGAPIDVASYWVSEKLDGVRGYWDGERLLTRSGRAVAAPEWFTSGWPAVPLDGELWAGRGRFAFASATVRTRVPDDDAWRQMRFMVFDLPGHPGPFTKRLTALRELLQRAAVPWLRPVPQYRVEDAAALDARLDAVIAAGGEGLVLHRGSSRYRAGENEHLLKYKPHREGRAKVVARLPGKGKYAGMLGALLVERPDGLRFRIGTGFSDDERRDPPAVGQCVTYAYDGDTASGLPRFPRFLGPCAARPASPARPVH